MDVRVTAARVTYDGMLAEQVNAQILGGELSLSVQNLRPPAEVKISVEKLALVCPGFDLSNTAPCTGMTWSMVLSDLEESIRLPLKGAADLLRFEDSGQSLHSSMVSGDFSAHIFAELTEGLTATLEWGHQALSGLPASHLLPDAFHWVRAGDSSGKLNLTQLPGDVYQVDYDLQVEELGFDSPDGRFAGEGLRLEARGSTILGEDVRLGLEGRVSAGALLIDDFYTEFNGFALQWQTALVKAGRQLRIENLQLSDGGSMEFEARADFDLDEPLGSLDYEVDHFELYFPLAYERFAEAMASAWTLDGLTVTGNLIWSGRRENGMTDSGVLDILDLSIVDTQRGRFAITGLDAHIQPTKAFDFDQGVDSHFSWRGFLVHQINLGAGAADVLAAPGRFSLVSPLKLDVLGGRFDLDELQVQYPSLEAQGQTEPEIRLQASLDQLDMGQLTRALDWPEFGGSISGKIPGVTFNGGVLAVEGEIEFKVFDGQVLLSDVRIERPFGVLPSLAANIEADNLALQRLTQTFSFGQISGRLSGFVHDLRMLDWEPVAFDAWFGTPDQQKGSNKISRKAVNRLTNIGGGGATAALTGPVMKLFSNFSYRRLGLGCRLENNICDVRGLDDDDNSVLIMEGAGIPKIMIRAYNRSMDWPTLVGGLVAATQGESIQVGD